MSRKAGRGSLSAILCALPVSVNAKFAFASAAMLAGLMVSGCEQTPVGDAERAKRGQPQASFKLDSAEVKRGQAVYHKHCLKCHGELGKGTVLGWRIRDAEGHLPPPPLDNTARTSLLTTSELLEIVSEGSPAGEGKMPGWKGKLSEREIENVVSYIKSLWSPAVYQLWWSIELSAQAG